jgi:hypothetical protein
VASSKSLLLSEDVLSGPDREAALELDAGAVKPDRILVAHIVDRLRRHFHRKRQFEFFWKGSGISSPLPLKSRIFEGIELITNTEGQR